MSTIPLSKKYNPKKLEFPVYISEKLDGVPIRVDTERGCKGTVVQSRQGKEVPSVKEDILDFTYLADSFLDGGRLAFVAEVTHNITKGFKDVSGIVRRQTTQEGLIYNFFDYVNYTDDDPFYIRSRQLQDLFLFIHDNRFKCVKQTRLVDQEALDQFLADNPIRPDQEGWVIRSHNGLWLPGSRKWDYQKFLITPTEDLPLIRVDEAIDQYGTPKGMAGKLWVLYKGEEIGCGPGALTHPERVNLLEEYRLSGKGWHNPTIEVAYKYDPTYDALREARFVAFRPDKD